MLKAKSLMPLAALAGAALLAGACTTSGNVERNAAGLAVTVTYNNDLFEKNTIVQLMQGYQSLLAAMVDNPDGTVAALLAALGDPLTNRLHAEAQKDASYAELV